MIKKRYHFLIVFAILLIGIIVGSFLDYEINSAIYDRTNTFGLAVSSLGMYPGYGFLAFLGGITLNMGIFKKQWKGWQRALMFALSLAFYACSTYGIGDDIFSFNGFYDETLVKYGVGYMVAAVMIIPLFIWGYFVAKKIENPKMWIIIIIIALAIFLAIVPGVSVVKSIMRRPRYRIVVYEHLIDDAYHNWWEPFFKGYQELKPRFDTDPLFIEKHVTSGEFKSFPSGHAAGAMITIMFCSFIPIVDKRLMKYQTLFFYLGFVWCLVVMFARMLVGAHYLTDVCFGALFILVFFYIANEIILRNHLLDEPEENKEIKTNEEH